MFQQIPSSASKINEDRHTNDHDVLVFPNKRKWGQKLDRCNKTVSHLFRLNCNDVDGMNTGKCQRKRFLNGILKQMQFFKSAHFDFIKADNMYSDSYVNKRTQGSSPGAHRCWMLNRSEAYRIAIGFLCSGIKSVKK
jgi:hypothetical protein